jgi:hypothetical protein
LDFDIHYSVAAVGVLDLLDSCLIWEESLISGENFSFVEEAERIEAPQRLDVGAMVLWAERQSPPTNNEGASCSVVLPGSPAPRIYQLRLVSWIYCSFRL